MMANAASGHLTTIGFDADDTLWHNERIFQFSTQRFSEILSEHAGIADVRSRLLEAERRNLAIYGFGIKGFTLSMIETAIEVTGHAVRAETIAQILQMGRDMMNHPVETFPHAQETIEKLAGDYTIVLITKGDLFDQERKLAASGLGELFDGVEIVSDKTARHYHTIFSRYGNGPAQAMMVGNSLKSDIRPALEAGSWAVHVPYELVWDLEHAEIPAAHRRFRTIERLVELPSLLDTLEL